MNSNIDEETRHAIDTEVHQLRLRISDLLSKRNSLAPISRLPPELMSIIFVYAHNFSKIKSKSTMAMKISWICQGWRRLSLDTPRLWAEIDFGCYRGVIEFLSRSRQALLSITTPCDVATTAAILRSFQRIQALNMSWDKFDLDRDHYLDIGDIWTQPTPVLRSLELRGVQLPSALLDNPPPLSCLILRNCTFMWDFPPFSALTVLSIIQPATNISAQYLLSRLAGTPALTQLTLDTVLPDLRLASAIETTDVHLPQLRNLTVADNRQDQVCDFIGHLSVHTQAEIDVTISEQSTGPASLLEVIRKARSYIGPVTALTIGETSYISAFEFFERGPRPEEALIHTFIRITAHQTPSAADDAFEHLDLSSLEELVVLQLSKRELYGPRLSDTWPKNFGTLPNLRVVRASEHAAYIFVEFLKKEATDIQNLLKWHERHLEYYEEQKNKATAEEDKEKMWRPLLYEGLKEPVLKPINLSFKAMKNLVLTFPEPKEDEYDEKGEDFQAERVDDEDILYNLATRLNEGIGLSELIFSNWPMSSETFESLEEVVMDVENEDW